MLPVEVLVQAVVVPFAVPEHERGRPGLAGPVAAFEPGRVLGRVAGIDAECLVPPVGHRGERRVEQGAKRRHRVGERVGEVPVLAAAEAVAGHDHPAPEELLAVVERGEVPAFAGFAIFLTIAAFFALSLFLAVASVIPVLRNLALLIGKKVSFALDFIVWIGFILSWASAISQLSLDHWWARLLLWGGLALIVFMLVKMVLRLVRS